MEEGSGMEDVQAIRREGVRKEREEETEGGAEDWARKIETMVEGES